MKNLSIIYHNANERSLAPFYDLIPVQVFDKANIDHTLSMFIGNSKYTHQIKQESWSILAKE